MRTRPVTEPVRPRVFIVGGGFAGLAAARALNDAPVQVTLVDRRNHHVFQPLLYQVATASLSPADISAPIRSVVRGQENCQVVLAEVIGIDTTKRQILFEGGHAGYDYVILAAGATHTYFGHDAWAPIACPVTVKVGGGPSAAAIANVYLLARSRDGVTPSVAMEPA